MSLERRQLQEEDAASCQGGHGGVTTSTRELSVPWPSSALRPLPCPLFSKRLAPHTKYLQHQREGGAQGQARLPCQLQQHHTRHSRCEAPKSGPAEAGRPWSHCPPSPRASGPGPGLNRHRQRHGVALLLVQALGVAWVRHGGEEAQEAQQCGEQQQEGGGEQQSWEGTEHQQQDGGQ